MALKPLKILANSSKLYIVEVNCQIVFAKSLFKTSQRPCISYVFCLFFIIYNEIQITLVLEKIG